MELHFGATLYSADTIPRTIEVAHGRKQSRKRPTDVFYSCQSSGGVSIPQTLPG